MPYPSYTVFHLVIPIRRRIIHFYTFGHLKCPKAERIAPDKTPTCRRFNWQKV